MLIAGLALFALSALMLICAPIGIRLLQSLLPTHFWPASVIHPAAIIYTSIGKILCFAGAILIFWS